MMQTFSCLKVDVAWPRRSEEFRFEFSDKKRERKGREKTLTLALGGDRSISYPRSKKKTLRRSFILFFCHAVIRTVPWQFGDFGERDFSKILIRILFFSEIIENSRENEF